MIVERKVYNQLGSGDRGPVYTFDIDKTYLDTRMSQVRDLLRIPLELAIDKKPYPGIPELIRGCQRGSDSTGPDRPVYFLSASPSQMRQVLERRMELDELAVDGLTLKNWSHHLKRGRFSALRQQIPYKLAALLAARAALPPGCSEVLFGDDTESDAYIYSLYSALVTGALRPAGLAAALEERGVAPEERAALVKTADDLGPLFAEIGAASPRPVAHVFIHSVKQRANLVTYPQGVQPEAYEAPLLPAAVLFKEGWLREKALRRVFEAVRAADPVAAATAAEQVKPLLGGLAL